MGQQTIPVLKDKFADGKTPTGGDFGDVFDSYLHKSTKINPSQVLGLNDAFAEKADKKDLENVAAGLIYKKEVPTSATLYTTYPDAKTGWAAKVTATGTIWQCEVQTDGSKVWSDTGLTTFPDNVATLDDLATKTPMLDTFRQGSYNYYDNFRWTKGGVGYVTAVMSDAKIKDESENLYFDYKGKFLEIIAAQNGVARDYRIRTYIDLPIGSKFRVTAEFYIEGLELLDIKTIPNFRTAYPDSTQRIHNGFTLYNYEGTITEETKALDLFFALQIGNNVAGGVIRVGRIYIGTVNKGSLDGDNMSLQASKEYVDILTPKVQSSFDSLFETNLNNTTAWKYGLKTNQVFDAANFKVYSDVDADWYDTRFGVLVTDVRAGDTVKVILQATQRSIFGSTFAQSSYNNKYPETYVRTFTENTKDHTITQTIDITAKYDHAYLHVWNQCLEQALIKGTIKAVSVTKRKRNTSVCAGLNSGYVSNANTALTDYSALLKGFESTVTRMLNRLVVNAKSDGYITVNTGFIEQTNKFNLNKTYKIPVKKGFNDLQNLNILVLAGETPQFLLDNIYSVDISGQRTLGYFTVMTNTSETEPLTTRTDFMPAILYSLENAAFEVSEGGNGGGSSDNTGLILIAPNQKKYRVLVRDNGDLYTVGNFFKKVAILGNSYTWHGLASAENPATGQTELFWWGTWGMAASERAKDYAHLFSDRIKAVNPDAVISIKNVAAFEINHTTYTDAQIDALIADVVFADTDLISINLGGNATPDGWGDNFGRFLDRLHAKAPNAFILASGTPTTGTAKTYSMQQAAEKRGIRFVSTLHLNQAEYKSSIGAQVYGDDGQLHTVWHSGVGNHLGDKGMATYADLFAKELFL